jgi:hypothetical protein
MEPQATPSPQDVAVRRVRARRTALLLGLLALGLCVAFIAVQVLHVHRG